MIAALVVVTSAACAESKPATVSEDFKSAVNSMLSTVGSGSSPTFEALTCGGVLDAPGDEQVAMWADAQVPEGSADKLRSAGIAAGWQPQRADGFDLFLVGPNNVKFALRGSKVRAEQAKCSISGRHQELSVDVRPDLTPGQTKALSAQLGPAVAAAEAVHEVIGKALDHRKFPTSGKIESAGGLSLSTCGEKNGPRGVQWSGSTEHQLDAATDPAALERKIIDRLPSGLTVDERPGQPGYFQATASGVSLSMSISPKKQQDGSKVFEFEFDAQSADCVPVTVS